MSNKVLIIDDDENILAYAAEVLRAKGYEVETATTSENLKADIRLGQPDVLLLDYLMPDRDGLTVLRSLRESHAGVPVVMMTATPDQVVAVECFRAGAADFISKPFDSDFLEIVIRRAIDHGSDNLRNLVLSLLRYARHLDTCNSHQGGACSCSMVDTTRAVSTMMSKRFK